MAISRQPSVSLLGRGMQGQARTCLQYLAGDVVSDQARQRAGNAQYPVQIHARVVSHEFQHVYQLFGTHIAACPWRSAEHTSELPSLMRISYAVFFLQKKKFILRI